MPWAWWPLPHYRPPPSSGAAPKPAFIRRSDLRTQYARLHDGSIHAVSTATLKWTNPTTRTDGSALSPAEIASVDIFDTDMTTPIANVPGAATQFTTQTLTVGVHNFAVVINDTEGHKSAPSNSASVTVEAVQAAPSAVADLTATLNS